ncbi:hypothetical protein [Lacrimispora sp.]|uniref:hypothetical protein n=1 Tax=Lacrimispora sp. TaxID=2719234 RepID=UPI002897B4C8|nr:hypothetical protein [Lacrimispora sp.]
MAYYRKCPSCGANLDPGESCWCQEEETDSGYIGIGPEMGIFVRKEDAYSHALGSGVDIPEEIKESPKEVEEWYYSGNFVKVG